MPDKDIGKDKYKIVKSKNIDCGSYDPLKSFRTTQLHGFEVKGYIGKSPKKNYIDDIIRAKKGKLPPNHYKVNDAYKNLSSSPISIRMKRH